VDHNSIEGILESATMIGKRCGVAREAAALRATLETELDGIAHAVAGRSRPRVMICLGRNADSMTFRAMSAAGPGGIYDDLITRAGGMNAIPAGSVLHPSLSAEALLQIDPDIIVEFAPNRGPAARLREQWRSLPSLRAVRSDRVFVFTQDFLSIPGPRLVHFVRDLARALHPDASWS
jgi:iron complex transport system substrate-binding protein